jgi:hypothetical protein
MKLARYDIARDICSFDFYTVAVIAAARGYTGFVFDGLDNPKCGKWSKEAVLLRFHSIIKPGPAMLSMSMQFGAGGDYICHPHTRNLVAFSRAGFDFPRLRSVRTPKNVKYTVTIRDERRIPGRNSNQIAWRAFAKNIGAYIIEDYSVSPLPLHERMAFYAGAQMNFGVPNGPLFPLLLSEYPVMIFGCDRVVGALGNANIELGQQMPWSRPNQKLVWEPDDLPTLMQHFEEMTSERNRRSLVAG